jgi:tetratricopeptide (TPR) repeat protein
MFRKDKREAAALWDQGSRYVQEGDIQTGIELLAQAADLYEEVGALQEAVESADALAILLTNVGAPEEALHFYRRSLALEQWRGNRPGAATSWANMGTLHLIMGNTSEALTCQQEALSLFRSLGDQGGEAHVLFNLGNIYVESDAHVALTHYEQAATLTESLGLDAILFGTLAALGTIYSRIGRPEQAVVTLERALTCLDRFSEQARVELVMAAEDPDDPELTILEQLTTICTERRDFSRAMEYCHRGLAKQRAAGDQQGVAKFKGLLGSIHLEVGETDQALEYTDDALRFLRQNPDDPEALARNLGQLARVYQQRGELRHALTTCRTHPTQSGSATAAHRQSGVGLSRPRPVHPGDTVLRRSLAACPPPRCQVR